MLRELKMTAVDWLLVIVLIAAATVYLVFMYSHGALVVL